MALTYPLTTAQFFQKLPIQSISFYLPEAVEINRGGAGEIFTAEVGARLWQGTVTLAPQKYATSGEDEALLALVQHSGASFYMYDHHRRAPLKDPTGSIMGASSPVIASLNANTRELTISGLPAAYVISPGDYIGFNYGSSPVRVAYHQVVIGGTASGGGVSPSIEVIPPIRSGATVSTAVRFFQGPIKAVVVPGSVQRPTGARGLTSGLSFDFLQTLR